MKQQINPVVAIIAIAVVLGLTAFAWTRLGGVQRADQPPPTMPPSVAQEWNKYTGGAASGPPAAPGAAPQGVPTGPPQTLPTGPGR